MDAIGYQTNVDCYGCSFESINSQTNIKKLLIDICQEIGAHIVASNIHLFKPQGISAYAIITTSHIAIHTWPEFGFAAVDIFSCKGKIPNEVNHAIKKAFSAKYIIVNNFKRGEIDNIAL